MADYLKEMDLYTSDILIMEKQKEKEFIFLKMDPTIKASLKIIKQMIKMDNINQLK